MNYSIVRHNPPTFIVDSVVTDAPAVPVSDNHCCYIEVAQGVVCEAGMLFDSVSKTFIWGPSSRRLTHFEFMIRVGYPKIAGILAATAVDVEVKTAWAFAENADFIDLDHDMTASMLGMFALKGLLSADDVAVLLAGGSL
jgi:hypothetical protein